MADLSNVRVIETATVGDTAYRRIGTAIGEIIYAVRPSGTQERLIVAENLALPFRALSGSEAPTEPLAQLRHEQTVLNHAQVQAARQQQSAQSAADRHDLDTDLDNGAIDAEGYVSELAATHSQDTGILANDPHTHLTERLQQHRTLAWLEKQLRIGPIAQVLDSADAKRVELGEPDVADHLEHTWAQDDSRPLVPHWRQRPHGASSDWRLRMQIRTARSDARAAADAARDAAATADTTWSDAIAGHGPAMSALHAEHQRLERAVSLATRSRTQFLDATAASHAARDMDARAQAKGRQAHRNPVALMIRGTTRSGLLRQAAQLRAQATTARQTAAQSRASATDNLELQRNLHPGDPVADLVDLRHRLPALRVKAIATDSSNAAAQRQTLLTLAARLNNCAARQDDRAAELSLERDARTQLSPGQQARENEQRRAAEMAARNRQQTRAATSRRGARTTAPTHQAHRRPPARGAGPSAA